MEPDLLCSRNARPQKALVARAQWKINQPLSLRDNERAWKDGKGTHVGPVLPERASFDGRT